MIDAIIFDMNGVIIDDERQQAEAWRRLCARHGLPISETAFAAQVMGRPESATLADVFGRNLTTAEVAELSAERVALTKELLATQLPVVPGLRDALAAITVAGIPMAVATSSRRPYTDYVIGALALRHYFRAIVTAEDVQRGKPDPEIYLTAANQLGVAPAGCVVFEDSRSGVAAARAAGMFVIGVTTTQTAALLSGVDAAVADFRGLTYQAITQFVDAKKKPPCA